MTYTLWGDNKCGEDSYKGSFQTLQQAINKAKKFAQLHNTASIEWSERIPDGEGGLSYEYILYVYEDGKLSMRLEDTYD